MLNKGKFNLFEACEKCKLTLKAQKEMSRAKRLLEVLAHELLRHDSHPVSIGKKDLGYEVTDIDIIRLGMLSLNANANKTAKKKIGKVQ